MMRPQSERFDSPRLPKAGAGLAGLSAWRKSATMEFETERLLIRDFVAEDWLAAHAYRGDPEVARYMAPRVAESLDQTRVWLEESLRESTQPARRLYNFALALRSDGRLMEDAVRSALSPIGPERGER